MKNLILSMGISSVLIWCSMANATFISGSTGADGAFNPTANTVVTLPPDGILNYTTINIPSGVTVTFQKNAANTPVYMLASGDVTIGGTISVNGQTLAAADGTAAGKGGSGGYDGGFGGATGLPGGIGMGPGGGGGGPSSSSVQGGGGGYASQGGSYGANYGAGGTAYGNARLMPLIGGSGGGGSAGWTSSSGYGGSGGGGAILIASSGTLNVNGGITANGGNVFIDYVGVWRDPYTYPGSGSGGAIRLVANAISGNGVISAKGGSSLANRGGDGYIRLEAPLINRGNGTDPPYSYGLPGNVFVANAPTLTLTSIAGVSTPATAAGSYSSPDMLLTGTTTNPVAVTLSAANIPIGTTVKVSVAPQYGTASSVNTTLAGTLQSSTASANVNLSTTYTNVITAQATFTVVAMYYNGEEINKVHVATTMGGKSETTYITKSGKRIKGELLAAMK